MVEGASDLSLKRDPGKDPLPLSIQILGSAGQGQEKRQRASIRTCLRAVYALEEELVRQSWAAMHLLLLTKTRTMYSVGTVISDSAALRSGPSLFFSRTS